MFLQVAPGLSGQPERLTTLASSISMAQEDSNDVLRGFKDLMTSIAQAQREFQANLHAYKEDKVLVDQSHQTTSSFEKPRD